MLPLAGPHTDGQDLAGTLTVPRNTERLLAEVYATGSGGGCEEFWYPDALTAAWTDDVTGLVAGPSRFAGLTRAADRYTLDGRITVDAGNRLTTTLTMTDAGTGRSDTYRGEASYLLGVPRDQRQATGTSQERYRQGRYDRTIRTVNGFVVAASAAPPR